MGRRVSQFFERNLSLELFCQLIHKPVCLLIVTIKIRIMFSSPNVNQMKYLKILHITMTF